MRTSWLGPNFLLFNLMTLAELLVTRNECNSICALRYEIIQLFSLPMNFNIWYVSILVPCLRSIIDFYFEYRAANMSTSWTIKNHTVLHQVDDTFVSPNFYPLLRFRQSKPTSILCRVHRTGALLLSNPGHLLSNYAKSSIPGLSPKQKVQISPMDFWRELF